MGWNCYIDESGDEGVNTGGTRWFILGGLMVPADHDLEVSQMVSRVKQQLGHDDTWPLHWSKFKKHEDKLIVCRELMAEPSWTFIAVAIDKQHPTVLKALGYRKKWQLYCHMTRLLLERVSWFARDRGQGKARPIFEYRANMSYDGLKDYLQMLYGWVPPIQMAWPFLEWEHFSVQQKRQVRLLQATDALCGALSDALEISRKGFTEPRYILSLKTRLWRRNGNLFSYGLKFTHATASDRDALRQEYEFLKSI